MTLFGLRRLPQLVSRAVIACALLAVAATSGCFSNSGNRDDGTIRITGSDTMVGLAQAWAEEYQTSHPDISAQVRGGGSGVGIAALINGKVDIAPASRAMTEEEMKLAKEKTGKEPKQFIVGTDALAIYVHKDNPIDSISIEELAEIYGEGGKIENWQQLGVENPGCPSGEIIRVSRQNSSGTYVYFRDEVLGENREYKQGTTAQSGSADVVDLLANTPCGLGYSGMGYYVPSKVKMLNVSVKKGEPGVEPSLSTALDGSYPIARPLYIYTLGEPTGAVAEFVQWTLGPEGQKLVQDVGYVPNELGSGGAKEDAKPESAETASEPAEEKEVTDAPPTDDKPGSEDAPESEAPAKDAAQPE